MVPHLDTRFTFLFGGAEFNEQLIAPHSLSVVATGTEESGKKCSLRISPECGQCHAVARSEVG